ncbi:MAG TPA: SCO family protein [Pirellulaceae bacterium]|jgi:protein SCO1/2|nr:SCO family protein [Pirellulaceae bacterium]
MFWKFPLLTVLCAALLSVGVGELRAQRNDKLPKGFEGLSIQEHLDAEVPMTLSFRDDRGQEVLLGDYFDGSKPVVLSMNYSDCPMLCSLQLNGLFDSMKELSLTPGEDFEFVSVSINPLETTDRARIAKNGYVRKLGNAGAAKGLHFLTGSKANVDALAQAVGFSYKYIPETKHYSHPAVLEICTPDGRLSRYLYGVAFPVRDLRLSLVEASEGKIGTTFDQILMFCLHFDPEEGRYTPFATNLMKLAGSLTVFVAALFIVPYWFMRPGTKTAPAKENPYQESASPPPDTEGS